MPFMRWQGAIHPPYKNAIRLMAKLGHEKIGSRQLPKILIEEKP